MSKLRKIRSLVLDANRFDRLFSLTETLLNRVASGFSPPCEDVQDLRAFVRGIGEIHPDLGILLRAGGPAEKAFEAARARFGDLAKDRVLPFPPFYNADKSLGMLCYALTRYLKPAVAVETGVGYGFTAALILQAMEENRSGRLMSIDLSPLSDPDGSFIGAVVPGPLTHRWSLHRGSSRKCLPGVIREAGPIGLFLSDSANIFTLQRHDLRAVWPTLCLGGAAIFNNIGDRFWKWAKAMGNGSSHAIRQIEKVGSVTGLMLKQLLLQLPIEASRLLEQFGCTGVV